MKLVYNQTIADIRGTCSIIVDNKTYVFTDTTPCYLNIDTKIVAEIPDKPQPVIVKDEKRITWDAAYVERLIQINKDFPPIKTFKPTN